jgi:hypothetical protein
LLQPEAYVASQRAFVRRALEVIDRTGTTRPIVIASCPPWTTALVALEVVKRRAVDLVIDLQDLWTTNPVARWPLGGKRRAVEWERRLLQQARGCLYVNDRLRARWIERWAPLADRPGNVVPIGFDGTVPAQLTVSAGHPLTIGYFGSVYGDRDLLPLLSACERMEAGVPRSVVHWFRPRVGNDPVAPAVARHVAGGTLALHPPVAHAESRRLMSSFDFLLTVPSPTYPEELTTKLYDYLTEGRPIIGLAPAGSYLHDFLRDSQTGVCVPPGDVQRIARFLSDCYRDGLDLHPHSGYLQAHSSRRLAPALASVIAQILQRRSHDH